MSESQTPWPKRGPAGKVQAAKTAAPDDAEPLEILAVGQRAYETGEDVETIWRELRNGQLGGVSR